MEDNPPDSKSLILQLIPAAEHRSSPETLSKVGQTSSLDHPETIPLPLSPSNVSIVTKHSQTRNSSLDQIMSYDQRVRTLVASSEDAENIPLPSSSSSMSVETTSYASPHAPAKQSSLEVLLASDQQPANDGPFGFPANASNMSFPEFSRHPLPHSTDNRSNYRPSQTSSALKPDYYIQHVIRLSEYLPHLGSILHQHRSNSSCIDILDYTMGGCSPQSAHSWDTSQVGALKELCDVLVKDIPPDINTRLIIVEDLTKDLISCLGIYLGINPQCFAEHLRDSGYRNNLFSEFDSQLWNTSALPNDYVSVKWYRPMYRRIQDPRTYARNALLDDSGIFFREPSEFFKKRKGRHKDSRSRKRITYRRKAATNILRADWHIGTNPDAETIKSSPFVLEERATVWAKQIDSCHVGMAHGSCPSPFLPDLN